MHEFVRDRITALRISQGLSEYALSRQLGQNKSYINKISSGKALPSMDVFFEICEFFEITPKMFFDERAIQSDRDAKANRACFKFNAKPA